MKRLFYLIAAILFVNYCDAQGKMDKGMPYTAAYSSNFRIGNEDYARKILDLWKDWDDNNLDRHDYFSDTMTMMFADGSTMKGKKENLDAAKKYRASQGSVKSVIHAWVPLHSNDRNEDVVCVWGHEENTTAEGKKSERDLHEVWWFNKEGKVVMLRQWTAHFKEM